MHALKRGKVPKRKRTRQTLPGCEGECRQEWQVQDKNCGILLTFAYFYYFWGETVFLQKREHLRTWRVPLESRTHETIKQLFTCEG